MYNLYDIFRYPLFAIGSTQEHEIYAVTSCCNQGMKIRVTDVAGVEANVVIEKQVAHILTFW